MSANCPLVAGLSGTIGRFERRASFATSHAELVMKTCYLRQLQRDLTMMVNVIVSGTLILCRLELQGKLRSESFKRPSASGLGSISYVQIILSKKTE